MLKLRRFLSVIEYSESYSIESRTNIIVEQHIVAVQSDILTFNFIIRNIGWNRRTNENSLRQMYKYLNVKK